MLKKLKKMEKKIWHMPNSQMNRKEAGTVQVDIENLAVFLVV